MVVQPPDGDDALGEIVHAIEHRPAPLRIAHGADHSARFVQDYVDRVLGYDPRAVDFDPAFARIRLGPQLFDDPAVDTHPPFFDHLLRGSPRGDPGSGDDLLEPLFCHGLVYSTVRGKGSAKCGVLKNRGDTS